MFSGLRIQQELIKAFEELGFSELTDIQKKTIPLILQGKDVIGQSQTGSGKTAAFGLPILDKTTSGQGLQVLILVPTRELCEQVTTEMKKFSRHKRMSICAVYGGVSINPQFFSLKHADVVVATPGRMLDHLERGSVRLNKVNTLVLDEADKMFEMGFIDDIKQIISQIPVERQTLLFSATISQQVHDIVKHYMKNPEKIKVQSYVDKGKLAQYYYPINSRDKFSLLVHLLRQQLSGLTIIFCATRKRVDVLGKNLYKQKFHSESLHGGLSQNRRKQAIDMFHNNKIDILVASDVAARGLDIKNVSHIINYDIPKTAKEYIHRIGRTARAGKEGKVISLLSEQDHENFRNVLDDRSLVIEKLELPEFERVPFLASQRGGRFDGRSSFHPRESSRYSSAPRHGNPPRRYSSSGRNYSQTGDRGNSQSDEGRSRYGEQRKPYYSKPADLRNRREHSHSGERSSRFNQKRHSGS